MSAKRRLERKFQKSTMLAVCAGQASKIGGRATLRECMRLARRFRAKYARRRVVAARTWTLPRELPITPKEVLPKLTQQVSTWEAQVERVANPLAPGVTFGRNPMRRYHKKKLKRMRSFLARMTA